MTVGVLLGRGAKDIVHFGRVEWDLKTRAGEHCVFRFLYKEGMEQDWESEALGTVDRKRHGTDAILHVQQQFRVPNHDNVAQKFDQALCDAADTPRPPQSGCDSGG